MLSNSITVTEELSLDLHGVIIHIDITVNSQYIFAVDMALARE